ncbi:MAG: histidine phosphatase family protein [Rhodoplanes sp.]
MLCRKRFYFLRHGQTDWNAKGLCQGQTDVPLNSTGIRQAHDAKSRLARAPIATICCSPLSRARQTAEIVNGAVGCPLVILDKLKEIYFAAAEGKPLLSHSYDVLLRNAESHGGEPFSDFVSRVVAGINRALAYPGPVLIVAHGGVFCAIQTHVRVDRDGDMTNCVPVRLEPVDGEDSAWRVSPI